MTREEDNNVENKTIEETAIAESVQLIPAAEPEITITIGQLLKSRREEKGLSLKVIAQQTKIHIGLLEYLEADQFDKLPSKAYVRGFIKSTTKILGLNQEHTLNLLDIAYKKNDQKKEQSLPNQEMKTETARNTLSVMGTPLEAAVKSVSASSAVFLAKAAAFVLIVGVVGFNVKNYIQKSSEESEIKLPEVLTTLHKKKILSVKIPPKPVVTETKPEEPIKVNIIQDKNQKTDVTVNDINLQTISLGEKQFVEERLSKEQYDALLPTKYRFQPAKGSEMLFINASEGDAWLTYKVDDKDIKKFVLRQGRTLFLRGAVIRLFIGNTRSVKAFYNNKAINLSANAKSGVKNIVLPEELKTKFMAPLFVFQEDGTAVTSEDYLKINQNKPAGAIPAIAKPAKTKTP